MTHENHIPVGNVDENDKEDAAKSDDELVDDEELGSIISKDKEESKDRFNVQGHVVKTDFETTMYF